MRILLTAIGGSDPIMRSIDGPMLHCCRIYKPDIVYMYFTSEMLNREKKDNRYTLALKKLGEFLNHKFEVKMIERPDLVDVQLFDPFFDDFENIVDEIEHDYPDAHVFVNVSSGTPAIKSTLFVIAAMSDGKIKPIQVSGGEKRPIENRDKSEDYSVDEQWECNIDNLPDFEDRSIISDTRRFLVKIKKENMRRYILAYDYTAAKLLADEIKPYITQNAFQLISAAEARIRLNYTDVCAALGESGLNIIPVKSDKGRDITEYLLWLGITIKKHDYLGFLRGITPAAMRIMEEAFAHIFGDIKQYCENESGHLKLTPEKLRTTENGQIILNVLDEKYYRQGGFSAKEYSTAHLEAVIASCCLEDKIKEYARIIRNAEEKLRNPAAHTITAIDDSGIKRIIGISADELYRIILRMATRLGLLRKDTYDSYDEMNKMILKELEKVPE